MSADIHCYIHDKDEPSLPDDYMTCFECNHVFRTEEELLAATNANIQQYTPDLPPMTIEQVPDIDFCPLCMHDF